MMLTYRQHEIWKAITAYVDENGYAPTLQELCEITNARSKGAMSRMLAQLEERGAIRRLPRRARCIELMGHKCPHCGELS